MPEKLKCSLCSKEATVHLTQIINNKIHKVDLCESCAQQKGVTDPEGFALTDLLQNVNLDVPLPSPEGCTTSCPDCGFNSADFQRTGRLGCATCYTTLARKLALFWRICTPACSMLVKCRILRSSASRTKRSCAVCKRHLHGRFRKKPTNKRPLYVIRFSR